jgi:hypothetical protein
MRSGTDGATTGSGAKVHMGSGTDGATTGSGAVRLIWEVVLMVPLLGVVL